VSRCGEQVWLGSCLLCDWLLHNGQPLAGQTVLELGAGVGLASILAARFAQHVLLTDADAGVLDLAAANVRENGVQERVCVRRLDWLQLFDTQLGHCSNAEVLLLLDSSSSLIQAHTRLAVCPADTADKAAGTHVQEEQQQLNGSSNRSSYAWLPADLQQLCAVDIWLAADVVYNETLTDAFMRTAHQLMTWQQQQQQRQQARQQQELLHSYAPCHATGSSGHSGKGSCSMRSPRLLVAVEKRYNFTYRDLDARASAFEHFMTYVAAAPAEKAASIAGTTDNAPSCQQQVQQKVSEAHQQPQQQQEQETAQNPPRPSRASMQAPLKTVSKPLFSGRRLAVSELPQVSRVLWTAWNIAHRGI
jgi:predicted nicotinamide N-methyase